MPPKAPPITKHPRRREAKHDYAAAESIPAVDGNVVDSEIKING